jgi:hypothetical protein
MKCLALGLCLACTLLPIRPVLASELTLPAGTIVSVRLADAIDSDRDSFVRQYAAFLTAPIPVPGGQTISAGSRATVSLVHNNSGWLTQLTAIVINGRTFAVSSSAGSIVVPGHGTGAATDPGLLTRMGVADTPHPASPRIQLASSTQLRFYLIGNLTPARPISSTRRRRPSSVSGSSPAGVRAAPRQGSGIAYLCGATDTSDRAPTSYYVADVLKTLDKPALVERRWREYLIATYPYRFANNPHATIQCTRLADADAERNARRRLEGELNSENADIIRTRWRYTLGPPPAPSADTRGSQPLP